MNNDSKVEKKCFIWTRVSTKYQEDNGGSLDDQRYKCEKYAKEHKFNIVGYFGGKHESAKTPGPLIREMIKAISKNHSVSYILVSQADRFSRNAGQGINILNNLIAHNTIVIEVTTGLDTSTPEGLLMINTKMCMSQWDNTNRVQDANIVWKLVCSQVKVQKDTIRKARALILHTPSTIKED